MTSYIIKYSGTGLSLLFHQINNNAKTLDYLDPITTIIKLGLIGYKNIGTKIGIHDHMVCIQDQSMFQCVHRFVNRDDRNQLYQIKFPIIYFRGLILEYIKHEQCPHEFFKTIETLAIQGLKRLKLTYGNADSIGSIITNCLDNYLNILTEQSTEQDFQHNLTLTINPMVLSVYDQYLQKWTLNDFNILTQLLYSLSTKTDKKTQNALCDTIDSYLNVKNTEFAIIRPV